MMSGAVLWLGLDIGRVPTTRGELNLLQDEPTGVNSEIEVLIWTLESRSRSGEQ